MKQLIFPLLAITALAPSAMAQSYSHTVQAEKLTRGAVAVPINNGVLVTWRSLVSDDPSMTFDILRDGTKINDTPLNLTNYIDKGGKAGDTYTVVCNVNGTEVDSYSTQAWESTYKKVHLDRPEGGISPAGGAKEDRNYTYTPDDVSVGDVDGDGEYELFVKWHPTNAADNSHTRFTGNTLIDCYKMDGTKLWRIDLGINIRSGNHYTQFMVFDFDGNGKAELMCKTAPGTVDGTGKNVIMGNDDPAADYRKSDGTVMSGPEYLTVFNGLTGAEINTVAYNPPRSIRKNDKSATGWGDNYGNRSERYLACVAYLDGEHPSAVFCRGYYTASYLWAVDFDGEKITERWFHASETAGKGAYGEGAHSITVGDVDADGKDEIVYGAASIDDDGTLLYRTGAGHGDALHLSQMIPGIEGLQVYMPHEEKGSAYKWDAELRDARTGEILYGVAQSGNDNGRGLAANIISKTPGYEYWSSTHRAPQNQGENAGTCSPSINFRVYWDGDLLDELLDGTAVSKVNATGSSVATLKNFTSTYKDAASCNSTKKTPNLQADIFGDWREEIILHDGSTESDLIIFTTPYSTDYKLTCLMQDRQYREAIAWQNVAYNQPPHLSYCPEEAFNTAGVILVTSGYVSQMVNVGEGIIPVNFEVRRASGVEVEGAPSWVKVDFDAATSIGAVTGTPDEEGEYTFTITTTGSADGNEGKLEISIVARRSQEATLMASYSFENVGATTPNGIHGEATAKNGTGESTDGISGNALHLNGKNYYIQEAYDELDFGDDSFTLELWIRSTDNAAYIFHKGSLAAYEPKGDTGNWVGIEVKNDAFKFAIDDDKIKTGFDVTGASEWLDGRWHQIVMVRNTESHQLMAYIDGELKGDASDATGAINCAKEALVIGNVNGNFDNGFKGDIDELRIYRGVLSSAQIKERYENVSGICDIIADADGATRLTVVSATTGIIVRTADGTSLSGITNGLAPDVYILVKESGKESQTYKFVIK